MSELESLLDCTFNIDIDICISFAHIAPFAHAAAIFGPDIRSVRFKGLCQFLEQWLWLVFRLILTNDWTVHKGNVPSMDECVLQMSCHHGSMCLQKCSRRALHRVESICDRLMAIIDRLVPMRNRSFTAISFRLPTANRRLPSCVNVPQLSIASNADKDASNYLIAHDPINYFRQISAMPISEQTPPKPKQTFKWA